MSSQSSQKLVGRISGLDLARGCAICGMIFENYVDTMVSDYTAANPAWLAGLLSLLEGRSAPVFVILAGIGISLMTQKARDLGDAALIQLYRQTILKRALFLFSVGFLHSLIWDPDILHFFAVYLLIGTAFLTASNFKLMFAALVSTMMFPLLYIFFDYSVGWDFTTLTYLDLWSLEGTVRHIFFNGFHPVFPWLVFFFAGMWLGRGALFDSKSRGSILIGALSIMVGVETVATVANHFFHIPLENDIGSFSDFFRREILPPMPLYVLTAGASAVMVVILSLILCERLTTLSWLRALVTIGQMSLSIYLGHTLIGILTLVAIGRLENQTLLFAVGYAVLFIGLFIAFAGIWRLKWQHGPLEGLMRRLS